MREDLSCIWISKEQIAEKVKELAKQLDEDYKDKNPLVVCILKGAVMFFTDIVKAMTIPLEIDFMAISSYGQGATSGVVKFVKDLDVSVTGRHVIIIEDIIDTGNTLYYLKNILNGRDPASVKICALLDKYERRVADVKVDYKAFDIRDEFVVGYGLDYAEKYRNLDEIGVLKREIYEK
ncbi:MAG: hypoxanthine phosphoribosyltransferase [Clostridiales bacterium]|nr:hypoxanthine phosphoribosyltransferase [Clostridiales bacterium]